MVQFGRKLLENRHEPWAKYYLDYGGLKQSLANDKKKKQLFHDLPPPPPSYQAKIEWGSPTVSRGSPAISTASSTEHGPVVVDTRDFESFLEDEVEKIGLFFLQVQGEIAADLNDLRSRQAKFMLELEGPTTTTTDTEQATSPTLQLQEFFREFHALAITLLRLIHFVEANVTGIRKILKKHDKVTKKHLTYQYVSFRGKSQQLKHLWTSLLLHQYEGITALNVTMKVALTELKNIEYQRLQRLSISQTPSTHSVHGKPPLPTIGNNGPPPRSRHQPVKSLPNIVLSPEDVAAAAAVIMASGDSQTPQWVSSKKPYGTRQQQYQDSHELDAVLLKVESARRRLNISSNTFQDMLAAQIVMLEPTGSEEIPQSDEEDELQVAKDDDDKWMSHFLNLTSTFLYMTNYYVVAPTSGHYAQLLGGDEALSGIIIGMTPIAALVSTILYSWWTSYSYKSALVFASTCSILGNIFYALGLPCNSLTFVIIGRLLNGFGSARSINRRYIADTFPPRQRTAQSANFVTAGALGMAAGPAIASLLHIGASSATGSSLHGNLGDNGNGATTIINDDDLQLLLQPSAKVWWAPENAPGWFMFVVWSVFLVLLCFHFEDPPKHVAAQAKAIENGGEGANGSGEEQALLAPKPQESSSDDGLFDSEHEPKKEVPIWQNIPVMTTFIVYFVLKLILECLLSSTATLTDFYFDWDSSVSGIYLAILGLLMLPANLGISILARNHDDRELILGCEVSMLLGCLGIIQYTPREAYSVIQYVLFSVVIFLSTNALEGPNMSLLSKTIPKSWSRGIFNVGLLATEAGTFGRAVGDVLLSYWGFNGLGSVLNNTFRTMSFLSAMSLALTVYFYEHLEASEKDD